MLRIDIYGVVHDAKVFLRRHRFKFLALFILIVLAVIGGVTHAFTLSELSVHGTRKFNIILFITGKRGFFSYFFFRFLILLAMTVFISLCGIKPLISLFSYFLVFTYSYLTAHLIGVVYVLGKMSVLPLIFLGLAPMFFITALILGVYSIRVIMCAYEIRAKGLFRDYGVFIRSIWRTFIKNGLVLLAVSLVESCLVSLLTIGIAL
jgi:hypothetical protein